MAAAFQDFLRCLVLVEHDRDIAERKRNQHQRESEESSECLVQLIPAAVAVNEGQQKEQHCRRKEDDSAFLVDLRTRGKNGDLFRLGVRFLLFLSFSQFWLLS